MSTNKFERAYSIKEVAKRLNIPSGTIRQWEKDLQGLLIIPRTKQGARFYTEKEIALLKKIKEMREKNIGKEMIRTLLERHLNEEANPPVENAIVVAENGRKEEKENSVILHPSYMEKLQPIIESFKHEMMVEIKKEMNLKQQEMLKELKEHLSSSSLHTIRELSKSIQRSNMKRKNDKEEITGKIKEVSELYSESFETLLNEVAKSSKQSSEKIEKKLSENTKALSKENKNMLNKVFNSVAEAKNEVKEIAMFFDMKQEELIQQLDDLKESTEEIRQREEVFQQMMANFREAAAAKAKKKWWQIW